MLEQVLRQFGYVQTVPRHPRVGASPQKTLGEISCHSVHHLDYTLKDWDLGHPAIVGIELRRHMVT